MMNVTFDEIDKAHGVATGFTKSLFSMMEPYLKENIDFIREKRCILLTLSGYVILSSAFSGEKHADTKRKIINLFCQPEEKSPVEIIKEQLDIIEKELNPEKVKATVEDLNEKMSPEARKNEMRSQQLKSILIKEEVHDEEQDAWVKEMSNKARKIFREQGYHPQTIYNSIYSYMKKVYGFVKSQLVNDFMELYEITEKPSVLRAISDDKTWKDIFEGAITDIDINGYENSKYYNPNYSPITAK